MNTYYMSNKGHLATEDSWKKWATEFYEFLPYPEPKDSWERMSRVLGLERIDSETPLKVDCLSIPLFEANEQHWKERGLG